MSVDVSKDLDRARRSIEKNKLDDAAEAYESVLSEMPGNSEALQLQKQNRPEEAIEQYSFASELFLARGNQEAALDTLERVAQLDPDNSARQVSIAELAEHLGKNALAARGF